MILRYKRDNGSSRLYLALPKAVSREEFLAAAKVRPGSYAERMISKMYQQIFERSLELKRDFDEYYRIEYDEFFKYCKRRRGIRSAEAQQLSDVYDASAVILEYRSGHFLFTEEEGVAILATLLSIGESE